MSAQAAVISIVVAGLLFWLIIKYDLCSSAAERRFNSDYPTRPQLSEEQMAETYFRDEPIDPAILGSVRKAFANHLGLDATRILPDDDFLEIDASLDTLQIVMEVEELFGIRFSTEEMSSAKCSVRSVAGLVQKKLNERSLSR